MSVRLLIATVAFVATVPVFAAGDAKTNFTRYCASCHGFDGRGALPNVPNLKMTNALFKPEQPMVESLKRGNVERGKPPFMGMLTDRELSDLINYMRTMP